MTDSSDPGGAPRRAGSRTTLVVAVAVLTVLVGLAGASVGLAVGSRDRPGSMSGHGTIGWSESEETFLAEMIAHHEEAVEASAELARSERAEMRDLGRSIIEGQTAEIERMRAWSAEWYGEATPASEYQAMMRDLSDLEGNRLDEAFLVDMIPHHMTAVMMARRLLSDGAAEHDELIELAEAVVAQQTAEIGQMRAWLAAWYDESWHDEGMPGGPMTGWSDP